MFSSLDQLGVDEEEEVGDAQKREQNQSRLDSFANLKFKRSMIDFLGSLQNVHGRFLRFKTSWLTLFCFCYSILKFLRENIKKIVDRSTTILIEC